MKSFWLLPLLFAGTLLLATHLPAQEKSALTSQGANSLNAYEVNREVTLVGTVVSYSAVSTTVPAGPRVSLQTPSGVIDVHLGDARLFAANHFSIQQGDSLRIVGENVTFAGGTQFVARIVQKGSQALLLRTTRGFPISSSGPRRIADASKQGSAL